MSIGQLIVYLVIALVCGVIGQSIVGRSVGGFLVSTLVGLFGAYLGSWIAGVLHAPEPLPLHVGARTVPVLWAIVGAAVVALLVSFIQNTRRGRRA